jgi:hypothetical protein
VELPNPRSPKQVISQHVTSLNRTVHNCSRVSTQENPDPLSPGLSISRFLIPRNGRSHNTWLLSIRRLRSVPGFSPWKIPNSCQQESRFRDSRFPEVEGLTTHGLHQSDDSDPSWGFHHGKSRTLVNRNPDSAIPDFPKWEISRHVASVNQTAQIRPRVFAPNTLES